MSSTASVSCRDRTSASATASLSMRNDSIGKGGGHLNELSFTRNPTMGATECPYVAKKNGPEQRSAAPGRIRLAPRISTGLQASVPIVVRLVGTGLVDPDVLRLGVRERSELRIELRQLQPCHLLIEVFRQHVYTDRIPACVRKELDLRDGLVR